MRLDIEMNTDRTLEEISQKTPIPVYSKPCLLMMWPHGSRKTPTSVKYWIAKERAPLHRYSVLQSQTSSFEVKWNQPGRVDFKREGGGFIRLDKMFNGELQQVLETFNESIWEAA